jgi:hypothetical protein
MTRRVVKDAKDLIEATGGINIIVKEGGRHTRVHFQNPAGVACQISIHRGAKVKSYEERRLRSQLRRMGLQL